MNHQRNIPEQGLSYFYRNIRVECIPMISGARDELDELGLLSRPVDV